MLTAVRHLKHHRAPSLALLGTEPFRAAIEYAGWRIRAPHASGNGDGHPVIVFPGLGGAHGSVEPLTAFCRRLGYEAYNWGRGVNRGPRGDVDAWLQELAEHVQRLAAASGRRMSLIGWSLGGIYAREVAKILKGRVRRVITIGTPFAGGPRTTHAALAYSLLSGQAAHHDPKTARRLLSPPSVPTTCIYSRSDGVVAWQACVQPNPPPQVENCRGSGQPLRHGLEPPCVGGSS